jgi:hypothetical protein
MASTMMDVDIIFNANDEPEAPVAAADPAPAPAPGGDGEPIAVAGEKKKPKEKKERKKPTARKPRAPRSENAKPAYHSDTHFSYDWGKETNSETIERKGVKKPMQEFDSVTVHVRRDGSDVVTTIPYHVGDVLRDVWPVTEDGSTREGNLRVVHQIVKEGVKKTPILCLQDGWLVSECINVPGFIQPKSPEGEDHVGIMQGWNLCKPPCFPCLKPLPDEMKVKVLPECFVLARHADENDPNSPTVHEIVTKAVTGSKTVTEYLAENHFTTKDRRTLFRHEPGYDEEEAHRPRSARFIKPPEGCTNGSIITKNPKPKKNKEGGDAKGKNAEEGGDEDDEEEEEEKDDKKRKKNKKKDKKKDDDEEDEESDHEPKKKKNKKKKKGGDEEEDDGDSAKSAMLLMTGLLRNAINDIPEDSVPSKRDVAVIANAAMTLMSCQVALKKGGEV